MLKSHEKFHSSNGKRLILVVDDEWINRELLGSILKNDYEVLFAADGTEALASIREHREVLSLVILDLMMPGMSGIELLTTMKSDPTLAPIPVIVITSDQAAEVKSLTLGANDFIPKPYPQPGVILARVRRTIELSEDRDIIQSTERDTLTGLYNREYFYRYAEQFDQYHKDTAMDAIVIDVVHFHMINERFGTSYGDEILRRIGGRVREMVLDSDGIVCRREADTFMVYCPHGSDYKAILENAAIGLAGDEVVNNRVRLRMGVYENADKTLSIERRFDRAQMAADTVRNSFTKVIGFYDHTLHEQELYDEQLIEDFQTAITEKQFRVFYQPKFDVRQAEPALASAEALVRWQHPTLGMISPGVFIPLFEDNGLIQTLDEYVWRTAAAQIRDWKERLGFAAPVSVNVSRVDMYDPRLVDTLQSILEENGLEPQELLLEITESAYTQDSEQIVDTVNRLRSLGFMIEMDDFGTGYSSLNMISSLPIDALKLDMQFIRNAFSETRDTHMLEVIVGIADYLSVPVIAEGVETEEQMLALKALGCDLVQGYFFSRPIPAEEYETFLQARIDQMNAAPAEPRPPEPRRAETPAPRSDERLEAERSSVATFANIAQALARDYFCIYYVDTETDHFIEYSADSDYQALGIEQYGDGFFDLARDNTLRVIHPDDQPMLRSTFVKDYFLGTLEENGTLTLTYRLVLNGQPTYVHMKASRLEDKTDKHIVIGISNIDAQIRREQAQAKALHKAEEVANRDTLTGVKSKRAFDETERRWNRRIERGDDEPFAIVLCDINDLKNVNDSHGHKAGDAYIREASSIICTTFKHSPVFRVGGDEFVVILTGTDFANRDALLGAFLESNAARAQEHRVTVACGMAERDPDRDACIEAVFERADFAMYQNKRAQKHAC